MKEEKDQPKWYLAAKLPLVTHVRVMQKHELKWIHGSIGGVRIQPFTICVRCNQRVSEEQVALEIYPSCPGIYAILPAVF